MIEKLRVLLGGKYQSTLQKKQKNKNKKKTTNFQDISVRTIIENPNDRKTESFCQVANINPHCQKKKTKKKKGMLPNFLKIELSENTRHSFIHSLASGSNYYFL